MELVRVAGERGAQMIVVGTHGRSGFQPVALGSTAARLALLSPRPTLLVGSRERTPAEPPLDMVEGALGPDGEGNRALSEHGSVDPLKTLQERRGRR